VTGIGWTRTHVTESTPGVPDLGVQRTGVVDCVRPLGVGQEGLVHLSEGNFLELAKRFVVGCSPGSSSWPT
jgi:hypothetical protein